jgi:L-ascorbate metabolism protein UlaG (beta-lactamase superfamily)
MKKIIFKILLLVISPFNAQAELSFQYTGIAGIYISDGESSLFFDPVFSRPNIAEVLLGSEYSINKNMVRTELEKSAINSIDGIFIGHTHQDHALDMHIVQSIAGGVIHGSRSTANIALSLNVPQNKVQIFQDKDKYKIGKFEVTVVKSIHGKIFGIYEFRGGELLRPINRKLTLSDYVMGGSYSFYVSHPEGDVFIQQGSRSSEKLRGILKGKKLKILFQGIANRISSKNLFDEIINIPESVESLVPIHHDNFFLEMSEKKMNYLWFVNVEDFLSESKKQNQKIIMPKYRKKYQF